MSTITKTPLSLLGYEFISKEYLPKGKDEYHIRNLQNKRTHAFYRALTQQEIQILKQNGNASTNWSNVLVSTIFDVQLIQHCQFFGLVRIGNLEPSCATFHNFTLPIGLYHSTIVSCDIGDNVVLNNIKYISHYIIGDDVILVNVNEIITTNYAKFGNGTIKDGGSEQHRTWLEVCNENGGRRILPFDGMLPGDAYLWSRYRDDITLMQKFQQFVDDKISQQQGYYGTIGTKTIIKNCKSIKDVHVGINAYIKGAHKLKNLTIHSSIHAKTQIGEGCELVNGIINEGCRIFYGVKAVRFIMASHSQLKYGARLINSYLGNNATISCCEVLNSLIFPTHEQHHNNSFLCAALVMGQSNIAAGATIGSNHNSRAADGEIIAGRGFWPGLCVSLKHNSVFASYTLLAKGDYPAELRIPIPFSLVSNDVSKNELMVMPGYWFMYNMYALTRNAIKSADRDNRIEKIQHIEYNFLAPDTVTEMMQTLLILEQLVAKAYHQHIKNNQKFTNEQLQQIGKELLCYQRDIVESLDIIADDFENTQRAVKIVKAYQAYSIYKELIIYYAAEQLIAFAQNQPGFDFEKLLSSIQHQQNCTVWANVGGQLIPKDAVEQLKNDIKNGSIKSWEAIHTFYQQQSQQYPEQKLAHALCSAAFISNINIKNIDNNVLKQWVQASMSTKEWMTKNIYESRAKDYENPFRKMVYASEEEMDAVVGKLEENTFIQQQQQALVIFKQQATSLGKRFNIL